MSSSIEQLTETHNYALASQACMPENGGQLVYTNNYQPIAKQRVNWYQILKGLEARLSKKARCHKSSYFSLK